jgi:small subunit ribosomal protein S5
MRESQSLIDATELALNDKLININRVAKVMKGGKRLSFSALVVTGDGKGIVGIGLGKANEVPVAINKANANARKNLVKVYFNGTTVPFETITKYGAAKVMLKPALKGTGIIAGGSIRAVLEAVGIKDILTKSMGSTNHINVAKATILALRKMKDPKQSIAKRKGLPYPVAPETPEPVTQAVKEG